MFPDTDYGGGKQEITLQAQKNTVLYSGAKRAQQGHLYMIM